MKTMWSVLTVLIFLACSSEKAPVKVAKSERQEKPKNSQGGAETAGKASTVKTSNQESPSSQVLNFQVEVTGSEEVVLKAEDTCGYQTGNVEDISDTPVRAFRDESGNVQMISSGVTPYRLIGNSFDTLKKDCVSPIWRSAQDPDPAMRNDFGWVHSTYTADGRTIYSLIHNEYHGWSHQQRWGAQCPDGTNGRCWTTSVSLAVSINGGASFLPIKSPPQNSVAWLPYDFSPADRISGLSAPSNMILNEKDGYLYATIWAWNSDARDQKRGMCVIRTNNITDPTSWRAYDGHGFNTSFYPSGSTCYSVMPDVIPLGMMPTQLSYSSFLKKFLLLGYSKNVYILASDDLVHWEKPVQLKNLAWNLSTEPGFGAYASIIDPNDGSRNFDHPGSNAYLYYTRFREGLEGGGNVMKRDLVRAPIQFIANDIQTQRRTVVLKRCSSASGHTATTTTCPSGYSDEGPIGNLQITADSSQNMRSLYECRFPDNRAFFSTSKTCEFVGDGRYNFRFVGYLHSLPGPNCSPLFRCLAGGDRFLSTDSKCEGQGMDGTLGYTCR